MKFVLVLMILVYTVLSDDTPSMSKCCPLNQSYDIEEKLCIDRNLNESRMFEFVDALTQIGLANCDDNRVIVEYSSDLFNMTVQNGNLLIISYDEPKVEVSIPSSDGCVDNIGGENSTGLLWMAKTCQPNSICDRIPCVRKCCPDGQTLANDDYELVCRKNSKGLLIEFGNIIGRYNFTQVNVSAFGVKHYNDKCALFEIYGSYYSRFNVKNGHLYGTYYDKEYQLDDYCVDHIKYTDSDYEHEYQEIFKCYHYNDRRESRKDLTVCIAIATLLIGITLIVTLGISKSWTMVDRAHIRFVSCLFCSYCFDLWRLLLAETHYIVCVILASFIFYCSIALYTWITVVFFEIWRFYRVKFTGTSLKNRFIYYSIYGWGVPFLLLALNCLIEGLHPYPTTYSPNSSIANCWYYDLELDSLFYFIPVAIMFLVIIVFCLMIKNNVRQVTNTVNRQITDNNEQLGSRKKYRAKTILHMKFISIVMLFYVLGIFLIIAFHNRWNIDNYFSVVPGVVIFIVFVLNKATLQAIRKRLVNHQNRDEQKSESGSDVVVTFREGIIQNS